ncbi:hypothetical protein CHARACLAT_004214 [Characodon lateralis]|uniref:Uncharacterized protein n=1 Tax=Characodon lateralis TaxID=208331 RepID=A0ABU7CNG4_9TELE|nr:hypothetical protein [Characodon lateralis]
MAIPPILTGWERRVSSPMVTLEELQISTVALLSNTQFISSPGMKSSQQLACQKINRSWPGNLTLHINLNTTIKFDGGVRHAEGFFSLAGTGKLVRADKKMDGAKDRTNLC